MGNSKKELLSKYSTYQGCRKVWKSGGGGGICNLGAKNLGGREVSAGKNLGGRPPHSAS